MTKCTNCGAVMPAGAPGMTLRCEFCGVQTRIPQAPIPMVPFGGGQPPIYPVPQGYMPGAPVKMSPVYYIVPFAFTLGIAGFGIFMSAHAQREAQERAIQAQQQAMAQANQAANEAQGAANAAAMTCGASRPCCDCCDSTSFLSLHPCACSPSPMRCVPRFSCFDRDAWRCSRCATPCVSVSNCN